MSTTAIYIYIQALLWAYVFNYFEYKPRSGNVESYGVLVSFCISATHIPDKNNVVEEKCILTQNFKGSAQWLPNIITLSPGVTEESGSGHDSQETQSSALLTKDKT